MEEKMSGIVLSAVSVGENDKILNIFTLEKGVISAKIKGVKKAGAKLKFAAEPFCFAEYVFTRTADKRTVIGASLIDSFYPVREDIKKYFSAGAVLEFIKRFYRESIISPDDFFLAVNTLKNIAYGQNSTVAPLVVFLVNAIKDQGYMLNLDGCFYCKKDIVDRAFFDYRVGSFVCERCYDHKGREINFNTYVSLKKAEQGELVDGEGAVMALRLINYYLNNRLDEKFSTIDELLKLTA